MRCVLILSVLLAAHHHGESCQRAWPDPMTGFDWTSYVFVGEVVDAAGPASGHILMGEAWGLRIKVTDAVWVPTDLADVFEVFEYNLGAACHAVGISQDEILGRYPLGSRVRVIAWESTALASWLPDGTLRLDGQPHNQRAIITRVYGDEPFHTTSTSIHDFSGSPDPDTYVAHKESDPCANPLFWWREGFVRFELMKELLRLERARSEGDRIAVLERLAQYPRSASREIDYPAIVERFVKSPDRRSELFELRTHDDGEQ